MMTLLVAALSFIGFIVAYHTYGRWLSRRIFRTDPTAVVPSVELQDDVDYVPTNRHVLFGHHFTSIAGTGPIVGPAIAVFWGWLPALLWVVLGSIFVGAVHDFAALVISLRNQGQTIGEVAGRLINPRARLLFLLILFFALTIVLAIFGLVIASIFTIYPESVLSVWVAMPVAVGVGLWVHRRQGSLLMPSIAALAILYGSVLLGVYTDFFQLHLPEWLWIAGSPVITWTVVLMGYCFIASVLPVWVLLQPRDFINSQQLLVALALLIGGFVVACLTGQADLADSAPAVATVVPADAPPIFPFLFITIACGACSGFHCLVSSGTSSKQISSEADAQYVGYGSMLLEGALAVLVILACCAGLGMGSIDNSGGEWAPVVSENGGAVVGREAWRKVYEADSSWAGFSLGAKIGAFVQGGANFVNALGIPLKLGVGIIAVLVACFAATTLDTATRLQRYVIQELAGTLHLQPLSGKYAATLCAVTLGTLVAMIPGGPNHEAGKGGLILWPLFGATNQLLAGLAFLVLVFYLARRGLPVLFALIPAFAMSILPTVALFWQLFNSETGWLGHGQWLLTGFALAILALQAWMVLECVLLYPRIRGVIEEEVQPLTPAHGGTG